ncbi:hypothetical protein EV424DRAFT_1343511 [Suillus variegatus]|nr:hypothetical protein EV424DRAFT_1343511 [Suillus variegatus]
MGYYGGRVARIIRTLSLKGLVAHVPSSSQECGAKQQAEPRLSVAFSQEQLWALQDTIENNRRRIEKDSNRSRSTSTVTKGHYYLCLRVRPRGFPHRTQQSCFLLPQVALYLYRGVIGTQIIHTRTQNEFSSPWSLSPSSSKTKDDNINAPASLPPIVSYLSFVVNRAKARPPTIGGIQEQWSSALLKGALYQGKSLVAHGLRNMSSEAVAQAVLTKEADLEWKRLRALASAWEIEVSQRHTRLLQILLEDEATCFANATKEPLAVSLEALANCNMAELKNRTAFSMAAYSQDRTSFIATDAQLDHLECLAHEHYLPMSDEDTHKVGAHAMLGCHYTTMPYDTLLNGQRNPRPHISHRDKTLLRQTGSSSVSTFYRDCLKSLAAPMEMLCPTVTAWLLQLEHDHCDQVAASTTAVAPLEPGRSWSSAPELWGELPEQLTAVQPQPQAAAGSSSHSNLDSFTADFFQPNLNESSSSVPWLQSHGDPDDNLGYHHTDPYDHDYRPASAYNVNATNDPYYDHNDYGRSQLLQPDLPVQAPVVIQNPPSFFQHPPNLSLWPIHHPDAHRHVGSSSHVNLPPAIEAPPHVFDIPLNIIDQKMNQGRKVGPQYHTAASGRRSNSKRTSAVQPGSLRVIQVVILPPQLIDQVKEKAHTNMVKFTFENTFFPADELLTLLANNALDTAVAQYSNAKLNKWRKHVDAKGEVSKLKSVPTSILDAFRACRRLVIFVAYELALPVTAQRGQPTQSARIDMVESLLSNNSFLDGFLELRAEDGSIQQFLVPLANRTITNILEIMLSEQHYGRYIFDGTDKWRLRLSNTFFLRGTTCR